MPFSMRSMQFLFENKMRNDKEWFKNHREDYLEQVLLPFQELVLGLQDVLLELDPDMIVEPKVDYTISRIYRDIRFSRDKTLYRDVMWCYFTRDRHNEQRQPGFFVEIYPGGFRYGCGYYQMSVSGGTQSMDAVRDLIENGDKSFRAALKAYEKQDDFCIEGESYKKSRYPEAPERLRDWLDRKSICFVRNSVDFSLLFSKDLAEEISRDFLRMKPIYQFLRKAELQQRYQEQHKIA